MKAETSEQGKDPRSPAIDGKEAIAGSEGAALAAPPAEVGPSMPEGTRVRGLYVAQRAVPIPTEPRGWKGKLADAAEELLVTARRSARDLAENYRSRDRFFKLQALIVGAWVLLSGSSMWIATGGPPDPAANALRAYVTLEPTTMGWAVMIENRSRRAWRSVEIHLDHGFMHSRAQVEPGERLVLGPRQFSKDGLLRAEGDAPGRLEIRSSDGRYRRTFDTPP